MHNAPSVNFPVGRSRFAGGLLLLIWSAGASAVAAWNWQVDAAGLRIALAWSVVLLTGAYSARAWVRSPTGTLAWDGRVWNWTAGGQVLQAHPEVALDLQHVLLLRFGAAHRAPWLWLEKRAAPACWDDLRRAVYSRARSEGLPGAQPPAATR